MELLRPIFDQTCKSCMSLIKYCLSNGFQYCQVGLYPIQKFQLQTRNMDIGRPDGHGQIQIDSCRLSRNKRKSHQSMLQASAKAISSATGKSNVPSPSPIVQTRPRCTKSLRRSWRGLEVRNFQDSSAYAPWSPNEPSWTQVTAACTCLALGKFRSFCPLEASKFHWKRHQVDI